MSRTARSIPHENGPADDAMADVSSFTPRDTGRLATR